MFYYHAPAKNTNFSKLPARESRQNGIFYRKKQKIGGERREKKQTARNKTAIFFAEFL